MCTLWTSIQPLRADADMPSLDTTSGISEYTNIGNKGERDKPVTSLTGKPDPSTADHTKFEQLQGPFNSGPEATKACLGCHNKAGNQFRHNKHWTQMALIFVLLFTSFGIHGFHQMTSFDNMVFIHASTAIALIVLWIFAIFRHLTTSSWRHYLPTTDGLIPVARFYAYGIFKDEDPPFRKHNPLQALTYLGLQLFLFPAIWFSGLVYLSYGPWSDGSLTNHTLQWVAIVHVAE